MGKDSAGARESPGRSFPRLKVLYLIAVSCAVFAVPAIDATRATRWYAIPALLLLQVLWLLAARVMPRDILRATARLKWLYVFLIACYVFLPGNYGGGDVIYHWQPLDIARSIPVNLTGLETSVLMCLQIVTVILASAVVRLTGAGTDLVDGLRGFGLPRLFVFSIDTTLALLGGMNKRGMGRPGRGTGMGRGHGAGNGRDSGRQDEGRRAQGEETEPGRREQPISSASEVDATLATGDSPPTGSSLRRVLRGDVRFFVESIEQSLARSRDCLAREGGERLDDRFVHDVSVISGIALAMMSLKVLKLLPGLPFMPGWKTLFFYPLYILAADLTHSRWGGTTAGAIMGVLGYLQGDGKYGALEILKHLVPGIVIDLSWPLVRRLPRSALVYCALGFVVAIARTSTEFITMLLVQARLEAYAFVLLTLITNLVAGTLSGLVTYFVLMTFRRAEPQTSDRGQQGRGVETTPTASETIEASGSQSDVQP